MSNIRDPLSNNDIDICIKALGIWSHQQDQRVRMMKMISSLIQHAPEEAVDPEVKAGISNDTEQAELEEQELMRERQDTAILIRAKLIQYRPVDGGKPITDTRNPSYDDLVQFIRDAHKVLDKSGCDVDDYEPLVDRLDKLHNDLGEYGVKI